MANAKILEMKAAKVEEVAEKVNKAKSVILFDYRGLTVAEDTALRAELRKENVEYVVLKNHCVRRAFEKVGIEGADDMLHGTNAFAFGYDDAVTPARVLKNFIKKAKKCEFKGGIVEGKVTKPAEVEAIADLPSREVLIARMLGSMLSPISGLAIVLDQIAKKNGSEAAPAAETAEA